MYYASDHKRPKIPKNLTTWFMDDTYIKLKVPIFMKKLKMCECDEGRGPWIDHEVSRWGWPNDHI